MSKIDVAGHLVQWAIELGQFNTEYRPRVAVKAQVLVDFSTEFTYPQEEEQPQRRNGWSRLMGPPPRKPEEQEWSSYHLKEKF